MTTPTRSGYAVPDSFGSTPGAPIMVDPSTNITYTLGFGPSPGPGLAPPTIFIATSTWSIAKFRLGPTWADAKRLASTWGIAKALVGS